MHFKIGWQLRDIVSQGVPNPLQESESVLGNRTALTPWLGHEFQISPAGPLATANSKNLLQRSGLILAGVKRRGSGPAEDRRDKGDDPMPVRSERGMKMGLRW
jgi:hypothetical protein